MNFKSYTPVCFSIISIQLCYHYFVQKRFNINPDQSVALTPLTIIWKSTHHHFTDASTYVRTHSHVNHSHTHSHIHKRTRTLLLCSPILNFPTSRHACSSGIFSISVSIYLLIFFCVRERTLEMLSTFSLFRAWSYYTNFYIYLSSFVFR